MKKRRIVTAAFALAIAAATCSLIACTNTGDSGEEQQNKGPQIQVPVEEEEQSLRVLFDLGYDRLPYVKVDVEKGQTVAKPENPVREGYVFDGWLEDGHYYDFSSTVVESGTLVASWKKLSSVQYLLGYEGLTYKTEQVTEGQTPSRPADPVREGYAFDGWYTADGELFDFDGKVYDDAEVVAKWTSLTSTVTLNFGGVSEEYTVEKGAKVSEVFALSEALNSSVGESGNKWIKSVKDGNGETVALDDVVNGDCTLDLEVVSSYSFYIVFGATEGVTANSLYYSGIKGNSIDIVKEYAQPLTEAEVGGESKTVCNISGYYRDPDYTEAYADGDEIANRAKVYVKASWTLSAYTLGADVKYQVLGGEEKTLNAKTYSLRTVANLLAPTSSSALAKTGDYATVTYGTNNQVKEVTLYSSEGNKTYTADDNHTYYVLLNDSVLVGLTGNLNCAATVTKAGTEVELPFVKLKAIDRADMTQKLKAGLSAYLQSSKFSNAMTKMTNANRMLFTYLRYLDVCYYGLEMKDSDGQTTTVLDAGLKKLVLDKITTIVNAEGRIDENLWYESTPKASGFYGYIDFLNTWAFSYQQYNDYLLKNGMTEADNEYAKYKPAIEEYLENIILFLMRDDGYTKAYNVYAALNSWGKIGTEGHPSTVGQAVDEIKQMLTALPDYTDDVFNENKKWLLENVDRLRMTDSEQMASVMKGKASAMYSAIRTRVAFGYSNINYFLMTYTNLGFEMKNSEAIKYVVERYEELYYELNEDGTYKPSTGCNWVGFSGAPITRQLLKGLSDKYNVEYEKSQQAYYPFEDKGMSQQGLSAMVNLDRLYDWYNHTLSSGANVAPGYAVLTMYAHGIDPEHYTKGVETVNADNEYNLIALWVESCGYNEDGSVAINSPINMAIAICYLAHAQGIEAPSPIGMASAAEAVIGMSA